MFHRLKKEDALPLALAVGGLASALLPLHDPLALRLPGLLASGAALLSLRLLAVRRDQSARSALYLQTVRNLALAIDAKDTSNRHHLLRVQHCAIAIATRMRLSEEEIEGIRLGALLHDIGKLGVPEFVLHKPGRLTREEFAQVQEHPRIGTDILAGIDFPWPVRAAIRSHHERWDGLGYPDGLKGEEIPVAAQILAVADAFEALTSPRAYRGAPLPPERAAEAIQAGAGTQFSPRVVEAFAAVIETVHPEMASMAEPTLPTSLSRSSTGPERAVQAIQRASSELWTLYEVAQVLSANLGADDMLEILARKLMGLHPGATCVFVTEERPGEPESPLLVQAAVGPEREFFQQSRAHPQGRSVRAARSGASYCGPFDPADLNPPLEPAALAGTLRSSLIVPLVHEGASLGTMNLYHPRADLFGPGDQQLLERIAARTAQALQHNLLFERTRSHAQTDGLTGLYNIRFLTQHLEKRCRGARRRGDRFAILCLDLDSFKPINDLFGHPEGDRVLRDLAARFQELARDRDLVARYGGDEFVFVLDGAGTAEATRFARRLRTAIQRYETGLVHPRIGTLRLGGSIGAATYPADGLEMTSLFAAADQRMYRDKAERKLGRLRETEPDSSLAA